MIYFQILQDIMNDEIIQNFCECRGEHPYLSVEVTYIQSMEAVRENFGKSQVSFFIYSLTTSKH